MAAPFPCMWGFMASTERFQPTWRCGKTNGQRNQIEILDSTATTVCTQGQVWSPLYVCDLLGLFQLHSVPSSIQCPEPACLGTWYVAFKSKHRLSKLPLCLAGAHVGLLACRVFRCIIGAVFVAFK